MPFHFTLEEEGMDNRSLLMLSDGVEGLQRPFKGAFFFITLSHDNYGGSKNWILWLFPKP